MFDKDEVAKDEKLEEAVRLSYKNTEMNKLVKASVGARNRALNAIFKYAKISKNAQDVLENDIDYRVFLERIYISESEADKVCFFSNESVFKYQSRRALEAFFDYAYESVSKQKAERETYLLIKKLAKK